MEACDAVRFCLPYPSTKRGKTAWNKKYSLNAYMGRKHYAGRLQDTRDIHDLVVLALRQARIRREPYKVPVEIVFRWDDGLDIDNHGALGKMITDALKGWVIQDDNPKHLRRVTHEFWTEGRIGVEVSAWQ